MTALPRLALSIRQPWAWAIIHAGKDIENRQWRTSQRGPICIHAAKGMTKAECEDALDFMDAIHGRNTFKAFERAAAFRDNDQRGGIIGTAMLIDCVIDSDSPWFEGRFGFVLRDVQPVEFIPCKGALGFFDWREPR